ncbi:peptide/nickel transport system substrate-binding protein [Virgibacillus subterraneus]|uniref:Peptide/nickel transport system substrate-binding protein n=2 Tax=Virgibacillus TaxID=84406 RepID=A0A1H0ZG84_9BACI|nr:MULTISPECIES: ABC transporter substrate-binding protein [Virgibacillus]SDQ26402.1 peptide/nickel transport system substrate-binding protein [Virgibacillus salinus]SEP92491.1 peptide/nickel transport system substrate-binding protein [Virgibacillus subterraneus]
MLKKRNFLLLFTLLFAVVFFLGACTEDAGTGSTDDNQSEDDSSDSSDDSSEDQATEDTGDKTLVFGRGADSIQLDPSKVTDGESIYVTNQIYDTLVRYKEENTEVKPALAEDWNTSEDGTVWTFKLREDVKFHDGNDFTAEDVVFNFERWATSGEFIYYGYMFGASEEDLGGIIESVEATGDYEVTFTLSEPNAPFLQTLAMPPFGIASPAAVEEHGEDYFKNPVGTGPFVFEEWVPDDSITVTKNEDYFGEAANVDKVIFRTIPDNGARFLELQAGSIDLMTGLNPQDIGTTEDDSNLQIIRRPSMNISYMAMNTSKEGPMSEKLVRQAINLAIDKEELLTLYEGIGKPAKNPIPPSLWGYNDEVEDYGYDVEKAKALLAEAGYADGFDISLYTMANPRPYMPQPKVTAQAIQQMLKDINVNVKITESDWDTHLTATENAEHDMAFLGWTGDNGDPDNFMYVLLDKDNAKVGSAGNIAFYKNDEVHDLLKEAQTEMDQEVRTELYMEAQELIHEDAPWFPIAHTTPPLAASQNVTDYVPHPTGSEPFNLLDIKQ